MPRARKLTRLGSWQLLTFHFIACATCACDPTSGAGPWGLREEREYATSARALRGPQPPLDHEATHRRFQLILPLGTERDAFALIARDELRLGADVRVQEPRRGEVQWGAPIGCFGTLSLGEHVRVGSIYQLGESAVSIPARAAISGYVKAAGNIVRVPGSLVRVGLLEGARTDVEAYSWDVTIADSVNSVHARRADASAPFELEPGAYSEVVVDPGATLRISSGQYTLRSLELQLGSTLWIDNAPGRVDVWVSSALELSGEVVTSASLRNILWGYGGTDAPAIHAALHGILVAPQAELRLPSTPKEHEGSFFARSIVVDDGARITHWPWKDSEDPTQAVQ